MLERLVEQRKALTAASVELDVPVELHASHWVLAEKVIKVLQVYEEATREASGDYASAAIVIPIVNSILRSLEVSDGDSGVTKMKREMLVSLQTRYSDVESNKFFALATLLDPRFKQRGFSSATSAAMAKQMLISEYESFTSDQDLEPPASKHPRVQQDETQKSKSLLWQFCDEIMEKKSGSEASPDSLECVVDTYLKELNQPRKSNPSSTGKSTSSCGQYWFHWHPNTFVLLLLVWPPKDCSVLLVTFLQKHETVSCLESWNNSYF